MAPDGTLILKNQTRAAGITDQGTMAMIKGVRKGMKMPPSVFVAVDGETLEVLDTAQLPELAATPHGITMFDGRIAIYTCADEHAFRFFWDPDSKKLSPDESWVVPYLAEGQSTGRRAGDHGRVDHDPDQRHRREGALQLSSRSTSATRRERRRLRRSGR